MGGYARMVATIVFNKEVRVQRSTQQYLGEELVSLIGAMAQFMADIDAQAPTAHTHCQDGTDQLQAS